MGLFGKKDEKQESIKRMKKDLKKLVKEKKYKEALSTGEKILKASPYDHDVLFLVGAINHMQEKHKAAISYFDKALEIAKFDTEVMILKAKSHQALGEDKRARQICEKILELDKKHKSAKELLEKLS